MNLPKHPLVLNTQQMFSEALRHHQAGRLQDADKIYRQILSAEPNHADSLNLLGTIGHTVGQLDAALSLIRQAISIRNDVPIYHNNLANVLKDQGKLDEAVKHYSYALALKPDFSEAHFNLGCTLQAQGKLNDAVTHYEQAITLRPDLAVAYNNLGNILMDQAKPDEAVKYYERALILDSHNAGTYFNLGNALKDQGKIEEALAQYEQALSLNPTHIGALNNLGVLLQEKGQHDAAREHFQRATTIKPDHVESHVNEAMNLLLAGDMKAGWRKYEWRLQMKDVRPFKSNKPLWDGSDLRGKTILLRCEQGFGDCIQFIRYAAMVRGCGARILLTSPPALSGLLSTMEAIDCVIIEGDALPDYDCHAPLLSLPRLLGTTLDTIPNSVPYLFPSPDLVNAWAQRVRSEAGLKVGLVWAGGSRPRHPNAHAVDQRRSMHITQLAQLGSVAGVKFFSLQKGEPALQLKTLPQAMTVIDHMDNVHDFADTAALIANLDLVISVDTSVVHLAGAIGTPVWVMSRFDGCWRWLLNREDSPWYPTLRIFRQPSMGDWQSLIEKVQIALMEKIQSKR